MGARGRFVLTVFVLWALGSTSACDNDPPPPPTVDPVVSPTSLPSQIIWGWTEFGAKVEITGGAEEVETTADLFSGRFWVDVPLLEDSENALEIRATDDAGNRSRATRVTIVHQSPRPETLTLSVPNPIVSADDGILRAFAVVTNDQSEVSLEGFGISFSVDGYDEVADQTVTTDATGAAEVTFVGLTTSGSGVLTATVVLAPELTRSRDFVVVGGEPSALDLLLSTEDIEPATNIAGIPPGTDVYAELVARDQADNEVDAPIVLVTDAPDALVSGHMVSNVTVAGTWTVAANVLGTNITASATMTFEPGAAATIDLALNADRAVAGETVRVTAVVLDAYGNAIDEADAVVELSLDPTPEAPEAPIDGNEVTIEAPAGPYEVKAVLADDAAVSAAAELTVVPADLANFEVLLDDATDAADAPDDALVVGPDTDVNVTVVVEDAYGNPIDAPVSLMTDAPGRILDGVVTGVARAGTYVVLGQLVGRLETAEATLTVEPGRVTAAAVSLSDGETVAGVPVMATPMALDAWGNAVADRTFDLEVVEAVTLPTDPADVVDGNVITIESPAGLFTIRATMVADPAPDPAIVAEAPLRVVPAPPAVVTLTLEADDPGDGTVAGDPLAIEAGWPVSFAYVVEDAFGNPVSPVVVDVSINAPGAIVTNDGVSRGAIDRLTLAGNYSALAQVRGTDVTDLVGVEVSPAAAAAIDLVLSTNLVPLGSPVIAFFDVTDAWGNVIDGATADLSTLDIGVTFTNPAESGYEVTFSEPGTWDLTATISAGASDTEYVTVTESLDLVPPSVDIIAPESMTVFAPGSTVAVRVWVRDAEELLSAGYETGGAVDASDEVFFAPETKDRTVSFFFTIPARRFGQITIYAYAEDTSGNRSNAEPMTIFADLENDVECDPELCLRVQTFAAGYFEPAVLSYEEGGGIRDPRELVVSDTGETYVALYTNIVLTPGFNFGGQEVDQEEMYIAVILPDGQVNPFATAVAQGSVPPYLAAGLAWDDDERSLFASVETDLAWDLMEFTSTGLEDIAQATTRYLGLEYAVDTAGTNDWALAVDAGQDEVFAIEPVEDSPTIESIFPPTGPGFANRTGFWDACADGSTIYFPSSGYLDTCILDPADPATSCGASADNTIDGTALEPALLAGPLHSCAVSRTGSVYIANGGRGSIVRVDPDGPTGDGVPTIDEPITGLDDPWGVAFDPLTFDMLVSDDNPDPEQADAVFRFIPVGTDAF